MKSTNLVVLWTISLVMFALNLAAEKPPLSLEIVNKYDKPIWILVLKAKDALSEFTDNVYGPQRLGPGETKGILASQMSLTDFPVLEIHLENPKDINRPFVKLSDYDFIYRFPQGSGKTKFVTFNPKKDKNRRNWLYPQTGTFLGLSGKSSSGYSLKNNIDKYGINVQRATTRSLP